MLTILLAAALGASPPVHASPPKASAATSAAAPAACVTASDLDQMFPARANGGTHYYLRRRSSLLPNTFISAQGAGQGEQCSANGGTAHQTCSTGDAAASSGRTCSVKATNSPNSGHCSSQDGTPKLFAAGKRCSSLGSLDGAKSGQCSVLEGIDSGCSSEDAGNFCSANASSIPAMFQQAGQCSALAGGNTGSEANVCSAFEDTTPPDNGGGDGSMTSVPPTCSTTGSDVSCSVMPGLGSTARCTAIEYQPDPNGDGSLMASTPVCSVLDGDSMSHCSVIGTDIGPTPDENGNDICKSTEPPDDPEPPVPDPPTPVDGGGSIKGPEAPLAPLGWVITVR